MWWFSAVVVAAFTVRSSSGSGLRGVLTASYRGKVNQAVLPPRMHRVK